MNEDKDRIWKNKLFVKIPLNTEGAFSQDVNVHSQDAVRLTQRLIELKKDNWELATYPMEDHNFVEPASWTDECKQILGLFERWLKE